MMSRGPRRIRTAQARTGEHRDTAGRFPHACLVALLRLGRLIEDRLPADLLKRPRNRPGVKEMPAGRSRSRSRSPRRREPESASGEELLGLAKKFHDVEASAEDWPVWMREGMVQRATEKAVQEALKLSLEEASDVLAGKKRDAWVAATNAATSMSLAFKALTLEDFPSFLRACPSVEVAMSQQLLRCCSAGRSLSARLGAFCRALKTFLDVCRNAEAVEPRYKLAGEAVAVAVAMAGAVIGMFAGGAAGAVGLPVYGLVSYLHKQGGLLGPRWVCDVIDGGACVASSLGLKQAAQLGAIIGAPVGGVWLARQAHAWAVETFKRPDFSFVVTRHQKSAIGLALSSGANEAARRGSRRGSRHGSRH